MKRKTIKQLIAECIDYALYMGSLNFDEYDKDRLREQSERLREKL